MPRPFPGLLHLSEYFQLVGWFGCSTAHLPAPWHIYYIMSQQEMFGVLILSPTAGRGVLDRLFPNVNSEAVQVHLASQARLGVLGLPPCWHWVETALGTLVTCQPSSPCLASSARRTWLTNVPCAVSTQVHLSPSSSPPLLASLDRWTWTWTYVDLSQSRSSPPLPAVGLKLKFINI